MRSIILGVIIVFLSLWAWLAFEESGSPQPVSPHSWDVEGYWATSDDLALAATQESKPSAHGEVTLPEIEGLEVERTSELKVETRRPGGRPVVGLNVFIRSRGISLENLTDANGAAHFVRIPEGRYSLTVEGEDWRPLCANTPIELDRGESRSVLISIGEFDRTIRGRVLHADGSAADGIQVFAYRRSADPVKPEEVITNHTPAWAITNQFGEFEIHQLGHTEYRLSTRAVQGRPAVHVILSANTDTAELRLSDSLSFSVSGSVTDATGQPLPHVEITAAGSLPSKSVTDADGRYRLDIELDESKIEGRTNRSCLVFARRPGYLPRQSELEIPSANHESETLLALDFTLESHDQGAALRGVLLDQEGNSISGQKIAISSAEWGLTFDIVSDENGEFSQHALPFGDYRVDIHPATAFADFNESLTLSNDRDGDRSFDPTGAGDRREFTLEELPVRSISGRVVDPRGNPIPEFGFVASSSSAVRNRRSVQSDTRGDFEFSAIKAGELRIETLGPYRLTITGVQLPGDDTPNSRLDLVADRGTSKLQGTVLDQYGRAIHGARVILTWKHVGKSGTSQSKRHTQSDEQGSFHLDSLARAAYTLTVTAAGHRASKQNLDLTGRRPDAVVHLWRE